MLLVCGLTIGAAEEPSGDKATVLTGILDQVGNRFVLAGEEYVRPKSTLRAEGFSSDNFARFVGHRVQVRGRVLTEGGEQILVVRRVADIKRLEPDPARQPKRTK
jgi:hypothetical protein